MKHREIKSLYQRLTQPVKYVIQATFVGINTLKKHCILLPVLVIVICILLETHCKLTHPTSIFEKLK